MKQLRIGLLDYSRLTPGKNNDPKPETTMLKEAIESLGHKYVLYRVNRCELFFHGKESELLYNRKPIIGCDVLIPRLDTSIDVDLEISYIKQFEMRGTPVLNEYLPTMRAKNKLRTQQMLAQAKIPTPRTLVVRKLDLLDKGIEKVGGYPVVFKAPFGSYGIGVAIAESQRSLYSALDIIWSNNQSSIILVQEFIQEALGCDYRAFVVGDKVIACMQRVAEAKDFRSNLQHGGTALPVKLTKEEKKIAVDAAKTLGLHVAGVDLLRSSKGPLVMEVNANPGFAGLAAVSGVDVAKHIVKLAVSLTKKRVSGV